MRTRRRLSNNDGKFCKELARSETLAKYRDSWLTEGQQGLPCVWGYLSKIQPHGGLEL